MSRQKVVVIASIVAPAVMIAMVFAALPRSESTTVVPSSSSLGQQDISTQTRNITYNAKFECGTISGSEGPLRPGHYDTDIGILNKQEFTVKFMWSPTANEGASTNSILKTLNPQAFTSIVCKDVRQVLGTHERFVEGFVVISIPLEPGLLGSLSEGTQVLGRAEDINLLEVQAFYTANALNELPHEVLVDKITFVIMDDISDKIPAEMFGKILDLTVPSTMSQISDPEAKVRNELAEKYVLSPQELADLQIEVKSVDVGVGTMIDDHAISISTVTPQVG